MNKICFHILNFTDDTCFVILTWSPTVILHAHVSRIFYTFPASTKKVTPNEAIDVLVQTDLQTGPAGEGHPYLQTNTGKAYCALVT